MHFSLSEDVLGVEKSVARSFRGPGGLLAVKVLRDMDDRTSTDFNRTQPLPMRPAFTVVPKKWRRLGLMLLLAVAAGVGWWMYARQAPEQALAPRRADFAVTTPVVAATAVVGDIDITLNALGTVTSLATVTIKSQISGYLVRVAYQEGQIVKKGDLLAEIDSRPFELALALAQGSLERDKALLATAQLDLKRFQELAKTNAIPRQQLDTQASLVVQYEATIISDQAQIDSAKLNITYCHIIAPVSGRVGLRLVDQGNYVTPGDATGLVIITQLQPISVIFPVAEDYLPQIQRRLRANATLQGTAYDRAGTTKLSVGHLQTLDNQIDTTTGTVKLRAQFDNEDDNLFPNQFVNIRLLVDSQHGAAVIPTSGIQRGAPGTFVYLLNADNTVAVKPIDLGPSSGERVAVRSGLSPGDRVVIDGADKLRNGAKVVVRDSPSVASAAPSSLPAPATAAAAASDPTGAATPSSAAAPRAVVGAAPSAATPPAAASGGAQRQGGSKRNGP
jgi:membrane fusion protein, multidrug efflux system